MSKASVLVEVDNIVVRRFETLTVWLRTHDDPLEQIQVELRVNRYGDAEIFHGDNVLAVKHLDDWEPMREEP